MMKQTKTKLTCSSPLFLSPPYSPHTHSRPKVHANWWCKCIDFFCVFAVPTRHWRRPNINRHPMPCDCGLQLRVIRAFKSTLEDLEEKRSEHSVHSLRSSRSQSGLRPLSDITYIDDDPLHRAAASQHHTPGEREPHDRSRPPMALTSDGLLAVAGGFGGGGSGGGGAGGHHHGHHHGQRQQRHSSSAEHSNNNNRATERKSASAGSGAVPSALTINGHHVTQPSSRSHSNTHPQFQTSSTLVNETTNSSYLTSMSPPQLLTPYQASSSTHYQMPPQMPPSNLLPVRYDVLDYDPLPNLPADLPRLVHETSI